MFDSWLVDYTSNVDKYYGVPGWVDNRELNAKGQELVLHGSYRALCLDRRYFTIGDGVDNVTRDPYTDMEHHWDEGYGYIYGIVDGVTSEEISGDNLLGKYLTKMKI